jgi:mono/diheme cytochrome c family protein
LLIALTLLVLFVAGMLAVLLHGGISAKVEPMRVEAVVAGGLRTLGIPAAFRRLRSPVSPSRDGIAAGRDHFADHCAICHANDGSGQTEMGRNLYPRPPDLRLPDTQELTDGEMFYIIENGVRMTGMPGFGNGTEDGKLASWNLVAFIRHLPQLTPKEKLEMERLNPKGPAEWQEMREDEEFLEDNEPSGTANEQPRHH